MDEVAVLKTWRIKNKTGRRTHSNRYHFTFFVILLKSRHLETLAVVRTDAAEDETSHLEGEFWLNYTDLRSLLASVQTGYGSKATKYLVYSLA